LPYFARTAQQSVLDGTNGLSSFKPCAYCRIVHRADIFVIAQLSCHKSHSVIQTAAFGMSCVMPVPVFKSTQPTTFRCLGRYNEHHIRG